MGIFQYVINIIKMLLYVTRAGSASAVPAARSDKADSLQPGSIRPYSASEVPEKDKNKAVIEVYSIKKEIAMPT